MRAKYQTLQALLTAIQTGEEKRDVTVWVDNDEVLARADDINGEVLWDGDGPEDACITAMQALGLHAEEV